MIDELKRGFKKRGDRFLELELSHFHPSLEIIEKIGVGRGKFVFNGLSQSDLFFQHRLYSELQGEFSRIKVLLRVIVIPLHCSKVPIPCDLVFLR